MYASVIKIYYRINIKFNLKICWSNENPKNFFQLTIIKNE